MKEKFYIEAKVKKVKIDKNIKAALKKANIIYPHPSLAFFKATYAKFEEANGNNVILAQSVEDDIPYLIGCQMNKNHYRYGYIMGQIIDAYVTEDNEIEIVFSFHKSVYIDEYNEALELMKEDKLTVSFELKVDKDNVDVVENGAKKLSSVDFEGVGLLFAVKPAYKNAYVLETAMKQIEDLFKSEDKQLVYASVKDIAQKWARVGQLIEETIIENKNGGTEMDKKTNDALLAKQKELLISEFGEDALKNWSDEDFLNEEKIQALRDGVSGSKDTSEEEGEIKDEDSEEKNASESSKEEDSEEKKPVEAKKFETVTVEKVKSTETYDDEANTDTIKTEVERNVNRDGKEVVVEKVEREVTYTYAQVEEIKADYVKQLADKDKKIDFLQENAQKIVEIRAELGDFVKDLSDEDLFDEAKIEIAKLKQENAKLKESSSLETAEEKEAKEEEKADKEKDEDLETGNGEGVVEDAIDKKAAVTDYVKQRYNKRK